MIAGVAILVLAAVLALALPSGRDDSKRPASGGLELPSVTAVAPSESTPEPTAESAAEPAAEPNNDPIYPTNYRVLDGGLQTDRALGLAEGAQVEDSYFDGAVFVGDSITLKLRQFVVKQREGKHPSLLGNAQFLTAGSFSAHAALSEVNSSSLHPTINGTKMTLEDALATLGATKVYIMLGMNDANYFSTVERAVDQMMELLQRIRARLPEAQIFVQSATPRLSGEKPTTEQLFEFDTDLYGRLSAQQIPGVYFVDVAYVMRDEAGRLIESYCSDAEGMGMHFTDAGCREWIKFLYTHTPPAS